MIIFSYSQNTDAREQKGVTNERRTHNVRDRTPTAGFATIILLHTLTRMSAAAVDDCLSSS